MKKLSPEVEQKLKQHLIQVAQILYQHTESEKLQDFETIEWELRNQLLEKVAPQIGEFFFSRRERSWWKEKKNKKLSGRNNLESKTRKKIKFEKQDSIFSSIRKVLFKIIGSELI